MAPEPTVHSLTVNGVTLVADTREAAVTDLRQWVFTELLRQQAIAQGLLDSPLALEADDPAAPATLVTEVAADAIEALIAQQVQPSAPDAATCLSYYHANPAQWSPDEQVHLRHVLFAVTDGVNVQQLRQRAEQLLLEVRVPLHANAHLLEERAKALSNCHSGADGGYLGWLTSADCAPEFARAVFGNDHIGVLPELVHSRFGFHVVQVLARKKGDIPNFDTVKDAVAQRLYQQSFANGLRDYLYRIAQQAVIEGLDEASLFPPNHA